MEKDRAFLMSQTYATLFSAMNKIKCLGDKSIGDLTSRQLMTFIAILHLSEEDATLKNIASKLGATKQSTAQVINSLKKRGLLVAAPSKSDGRAVNLKITDMAKPIIEDSNKKGWEFFEKLFHDFTTNELEVFWSMLKKLYSFDGENQDGFEKDGREIQ